jgi:hypothetical protein
MKKTLWAAALLGACLAVPAPARAEGLLPGRINIGWNFHVGVSPAPGPQLGPWYLYWPLEAHFQPPAPAVFPGWPPSPMSLPQGFRPPPVSLQPAAYHSAGYAPHAPAYWYGR